MPYVTCPSCAVRTFSAAYWSNREHCGNCGRELPSPRSLSPTRPDAPGRQGYSGKIVRADRRTRTP